MSISDLDVLLQRYGVKDHVAERRHTADDRMFVVSGYYDPSTCRVQVFTKVDVVPVIVMTQEHGHEHPLGERVAGIIDREYRLQPSEGTSLVNIAERFAAASWKHYALVHYDPIWIMNLISTTLEESFLHRVSFKSVEKFRVRGPRWSGMTSEVLDHLVGQHVDLSRGRKPAMTWQRHRMKSSCEIDYH